MSPPLPATDHSRNWLTLDNGDGEGDGVAPEILLVEDNDLDVRFFLRAMQKHNLQNRVFRAVDGLDALEFLSVHNTQAGRSIIVLSDLNMPRMNGLEFLETLRGDPAFDRLMVFLMTTSRNPDDICAAYDQNIAGVISKTALVRGYQHLMSLITAYSTIVEFPNRAAPIET